MVRFIRMFRLMWVAVILGAGVASAVTKVAVVGDSISTGAGAEEPARDGYPARLGVLLGKAYEVKAFAIGGHTLLRKSKQSLMKKPVYRKALEFAPDVAVIMLGTNDSNSLGGNHWQYQAGLETDLLAMIGGLRNANPEVLIYLAGPPPMYPDKKGLAPDRVANLTERKGRLVEVRKRFAAVAAKEKGVVVVDLGGAFDAEETKDGVHPTTAGHAKLARILADSLSKPAVESVD